MKYGNEYFMQVSRHVWDEEYHLYLRRKENGIMNKMNRAETEIKTGKLDQACQRYNLGRNYMRKIGAEAGAVIKVGKSVLYNFDILDRYMDDLAKNE